MCEERAVDSDWSRSQAQAAHVKSPECAPRSVQRDPAMGSRWPMGNLPVRKAILQFAHVGKLQLNWIKSVQKG